MISFFTMAIPMSLLALWNPSFIHKYYVQKKRPSASQIGSMMVYGIFYSLLNHFCMILLFVVAFPLYGSYLPRVIQFATPWNVQHLLQALVQLVAVIYMEDSMYYYAHRMCHTNKMLFKYVHQLHHTIYTPIALTGHYMSVTEFVLIGTCQKKTSYSWSRFHSGDCTNAYRICISHCVGYIFGMDRVASVGGIRGTLWHALAH